MAASTLLTAHVQALARALGQMRAHPLSSVLSVIVMGVAMLLPLAFYVLYQNTMTAAAGVKSDPTVNVYLAVSATTEEARAAEQKLRALGNAKSVVFMPREAALAEFKKANAFADVLAGIEGNPLPHAFIVTPKSFEPATMDAMRAELLAVPKVDAVNMQYEWARKLSRFGRFLQLLGIGLAIILGVAVVFVTANTIRLQILSKRDEIIVSRLIGATKRFVRRPFLYFGTLQGLFASILAVAGVAALAALLGAEVRTLASSVGSQFSLQLPSMVQLIGVVLAGGILGWIGAALSVGLYWRETE